MYSLATLVFAFVALSLLIGAVLVVVLRRRFAVGSRPPHACGGNDPERAQPPGGSVK